MMRMLYARYVATHTKVNTIIGDGEQETSAAEMRLNETVETKK